MVPRTVGTVRGRAFIECRLVMCPRKTSVRVNAEMTNTPTLLSTRDAAAYLQITYGYLRHALADGRGPLPAAREGEHRTAAIYFERDELDRWNASRTRLVRGPAPPPRLGPDWTWAKS